MSKYEPLGNYLNKQVREHIPMTFSDIERILGLKLPDSKQYPAWWSNNTSNNVMTRQWLGAGYQTESVNTASEKLVFHRISHLSDPSVGSSSPNGPSNSPISESKYHPVFGCMKGTVTIPDDVDMTEPADPEWAQRIKDEYPQK